MLAYVLIKYPRKTLCKVCLRNVWFRTGSPVAAFSLPSLSMYSSTHGNESAARAVREWHRALYPCPRALSHCDRARINALERAVTDALSTLERLACVEHEWSTGKSRGEWGIHVGPWSCESTWRLTPPRPGVSQERGCMWRKRERETEKTCQRRHRLCPCPALLLHPAEGATTTMREARQRTLVSRRPLPSIVVASMVTGPARP